MATKLDKGVTRESTETVDGRNIYVTLDADQTIKLKLKGMKSGILTIKVKNLYAQLSGIPLEEEENTNEPIVKESAGPVETNTVVPRLTGGGKGYMSLSDFRSLYLISADIPLNIKTKLEAITARILEENKG